MRQTMIPASLLTLINAQTGDIARKNEHLVIAHLHAMGLCEDSEFGQIYKTYKPANFESRVSFEPLYDIAEPSNQILVGTEFIHDTWELPEHYVCFTTLQGEGGYLLDKISGQVFDFDLGAHDAFVAGMVPARWASFFEFLQWYLSIPATCPTPSPEGN
ncbi:SMI1/KNR4 family protein [Pseudomonas sp. NPDC089406]|uniref:SMI1/KNR4 family protein n=1 Tax=Pseudomonas sp. NPDC089406 TaxID=3364463 RepID=UPI00384E5145